MVNEHLLYIIETKAGKRNLTKLRVEAALIDMAVDQAIQIEWEIGDRILDFPDGSRMGIVAPAAGTMAGSSRVMQPGEHGVRSYIRGNRPYIHGRTPTAWYWTASGKTYGKPDLLWAVTDSPCPKDGLWVRRFCDRGCGDRGVWEQRLTRGTPMPRCADCGSPANYGGQLPRMVS